MKTTITSHDALMQSFKQFAEDQMIHKKGSRCPIGTYAIKINTKANELIKQAQVADPAMAAILEKELMNHGLRFIRAFSKSCKN